MFFENLKKKTYIWFDRQAHKPSAKWWLALISFTESSFFPIPPDPFLVATLIMNRSAWFLYSFLVSSASVLGGVFGYAIGFWFFALFGEKIVDLYSLQDEMKVVSELFADNTFWTIFTAAFTPIPYKLFTLSAGLFKVNFIAFLFASILGRFIRFMSIGYIMKVFGETIGKIVFKYFNLFSFFVLVVVAVYILLQFI